MPKAKFGSQTIPGGVEISKKSPGVQKIRTQGAGKAKNRTYSLSRRSVINSPLHLTTSWHSISLHNLKEDLLSGDLYLSKLERDLEKLHRNIQEPDSKTVVDVKKRSRDGSRRVVKTSVREAAIQDSNEKEKKNSSRKKDDKENKAVDAQVDSLIEIVNGLGWTL